MAASLNRSDAVEMEGYRLTDLFCAKNESQKSGREANLTVRIKTSTSNSASSMRNGFTVPC